MLCPFCLGRTKFTKRVITGTQWSVFLCPQCNEQVPALYVTDYRKYPPVVVSAIGFRQHGKTVYFASLFHALKRLKLADHWSRFFTMALNEDSLDTIYENVSLLEKGELPDSTPKNFPRPTMIRVNGVPMQPDCTLLCYDTAGECFERPTELVQFAGFVRRAQSAALLFSLSDMDKPADKMHQLLNSYVVGMGELGGKTKDQDLIIVYTKGDRLSSSLGNDWNDIEDYLRSGSVDALAALDSYCNTLHHVSHRLREFTATRLDAAEFLHAADQHFRSISFCVVSALGTDPGGQRLPVQIVPSRVLDPLFLIAEKSLPRWRRILCGWRR